MFICLFLVINSECLSEHVRLADSAIVKCPFNNGDYACTSTILDREIKAVSFHFGHKITSSVTLWLLVGQLFYGLAYLPKYNLL